MRKTIKNLVATLKLTGLTLVAYPVYQVLRLAGQVEVAEELASVCQAAWKYDAMARSR